LINDCGIVNFLSPVMKNPLVGEVRQDRVQRR
jgi:hypothetical protein